MVGFVGAQARRRRRNRFLLISLIIIILISIFYFPTLDFSIEEKELPNNILPDEVEDQSSLISVNEDLKLEIFQKDQRIKFRDNQINELRKQIKDLKQSFVSLQIEYEKAVGNFSELENNSSQSSLKNINEIKILENKIKNLNVEINKYKNEIDDLKTDIKNSISTDDFQDINIENSILKNEIKQLKNNNTDTNERLNLLNKLLEEKEKEIEKLIYLKDQQHHG